MSRLVVVLPKNLVEQRGLTQYLWDASRSSNRRTV